MDIYLYSSKEVICFCENLFKYYKQLELIWKRDESYGNRIHLIDTKRTVELDKAIAKSLVTVFYNFHLSKMMEKILRKNYYYSDELEIERILQHAYSLLYDDENEQLKKSFKRKLTNQLMEIVETEHTIYLESICNFQLNTFKTKLIDVVGLAIDEFKQEEEYQEFINNIRIFLRRKKSIFKEIHIVQGKKLSFFKPSGKRISKIELNKILKEEPLYLLGLTPSDYTLAPLVAMAPRKIIIYGDSRFEEKTKTILNIFEERVIFKSLSHFPFTKFRGEA